MECGKRERRGMAGEAEGGRSAARRYRRKVEADGHQMNKL